MSLIALGDFRFSLKEPSGGTKIEPFEQMTRRSVFEWAEIPLVGRDPSVQYTGNSADTIALNGHIYPGFGGGIGQMDSMRSVAGKGRSLLLVDGYGNVWGNWGISSIEEVRRLFFENGAPRAIDFTIQLKKIDNGPLPAGKIDSGQSFSGAA